MAKAPSEQLLQPSVLDRLIDDDPAAASERPPSRYQVLRDLKRAVHRDLECLLNTRRQPRPLPAGLDELERSLAAYGVPDVVTAGFGTSAGAENLRAILQGVIDRWEPRFLHVEVKLVQPEAESEDRTLRFRIDALLRTDPVPEPIVFDSAFEPNTGSVTVRGVA